MKPNTLYHYRHLKARIARNFENKYYSLPAIILVIGLSLVAIAMIATGDSQGYVLLFPLPLLFMAY